MEEEENRLAEAVDPNLRPEDHGMVLRYLHYADTLLNGPEVERSGSFLLRPTVEKQQERESREEPVTASPEQDDNRAA